MPTIAPPAMPSFTRPVTHDLDWVDRKIRFYALSARALLALEAVVDPLRAALTTLLTEERTEAERLDAVVGLFQVAARDPELIGYLLLDAMRDEPWNTTRPPTAPAVDAFLNALDASAMVAMIGALAAVNLKALVPLLAGLAGSPTASADPAATSAPGSPGSAT